MKKAKSDMAKEYYVVSQGDVWYKVNPNTLETQGYKLVPIRQDNDNLFLYLNLGLLISLVFQIALPKYNLGIIAMIYISTCVIRDFIYNLEKKK